MIPWLERLSNARDEEVDPYFELERAFDDSGLRELQKKIARSRTSTDGMDSRPIDVFRQGVELTLNKFRFLNPTPKVWAGNINHWIEPNRLGQEVDFTRFDISNKYVEKEAKKWDPVAHLLQSENEVSLFNNGLQQQLRSSIDPFFIQGKKNSIEDIKDPISGIKGGLTTQIVQKTRQNSKYNSLLENTRARFDDQGGGDIISVNLSNFKVVKANYWVDKTIPADIPFHDEVDTKTNSNPLIKQLTEPSNDIISALITNSNLDLDEMLEGSFEYKSTTAGFNFADSNTARYGTDSIAFGGLVRGW